MKWYRWYKIYLGIGIFFFLSVIVSKFSFILMPNFIFAILFLLAYVKGRSLAFKDPILLEKYNEKIRCKQMKTKGSESDVQEKYSDYRHINTSVVGVTFNNDDGSSRQKYIRTVPEWRELSIQEYTYKNSPAFYVLSNGKCIGNIPDQYAHTLFSRKDNKDIHVFASNVYSFESNDSRNGDEPTTIWGCNIIIFYK